MSLWGGQGGGGTPYNCSYREALPEMGTFFRYILKVGISKVEVYERVGIKSVI